MSQSPVVIFYADDDPDDREFLIDAFEKHPAPVDLITCANGLEAIRFFNNSLPSGTLPCLIVLDLNMPILDGKEVLQRLRTMDRVKDIPVVFFTTSSQEADRVFASQYNAGFITKPVNMEQMKSIADRLIEHCADDVKTILRSQLT